MNQNNRADLKLIVMMEANNPIEMSSTSNKESLISRHQQTRTRPEAMPGLSIRTRREQWSLVGGTKATKKDLISLQMRIAYCTCLHPMEAKKKTPSCKQFNQMCPYITEHRYNYQLAFLTPGSSPARACIRNWYYRRRQCVSDMISKASGKMRPLAGIFDSLC